jgi:phosphohistidine phosphatase
MDCYTLASRHSGRSAGGEDVTDKLQQETDFMAVKPDYFCRQSGVVPYRFRKGRLEVFLITSRSNRRWIIPKGIIERNYSARNSAAKEALEEAGIRGRVAGRQLGVYRNRKQGRTCTVKVFPMLVSRVYKDWAEDDRKRQWVPLDKALKLIENEDLKRVIQKLPDII